MTNKWARNFVDFAGRFSSRHLPKVARAEKKKTVYTPNDFSIRVQLGNHGACNLNLLNERDSQTFEEAQTCRNNKSTADYSCAIENSSKPTFERSQLSANSAAQRLSNFRGFAFPDQLPASLSCERASLEKTNS